MTMDNVGVSSWVGGLVLEYCPYECQGCELKRCWLRAACRSAKARKVGLWESLACERHREGVIWGVLAIVGLVLVAVSFAWPFWQG